MPFHLTQNAIHVIAKRAVNLGFYTPAAPRDMFLAALDPQYAAMLQTAPTTLAQLMLDLGRLNRDGRIRGGQIPMRIWLEAAVAFSAQYPEDQTYFQTQLARLQQDIGEDGGPAGAPDGGDDADDAGTGNRGDIPERRLFKPTLLSSWFLVNGAKASKAVARLEISVIRDGKLDILPGMSEAIKAVGTGWLIAPDLLITNHHVIAARSHHEDKPSFVDFEAQALASTAHFDFLSPLNSGVRYCMSKLIAYDPALDWALLEFEDTSLREPLKLNTELFGEPRRYEDGLPLNIIQHPRGGPQQVAIRMNDMAQIGDRDIAYYTETDDGSSGSPVMTDDWRVVALHCGARFIDQEQTYRGESTKWLNRGVRMDAIMSALKANHSSAYERIRDT